MNTNNMMNRIKKTTVGKVLCRLVGEDVGQAMMEYVIIAVLIAAACAAAVAYFGHTTAKEFAVADKAMAGDFSDASKDQKQNMSDADTAGQAGVNAAKSFSK